MNSPKSISGGNFPSGPSRSHVRRNRRHHGRRKKTLRVDDVDFPVQKATRVSSPRDIAQQEEAKDLWFEQKRALFHKSSSSTKLSTAASASIFASNQPNCGPHLEEHFTIPHKYNIVIAFKEKAVAKWIQTHITDHAAKQQLRVGMDFEWDCVSLHSSRHNAFPDLIQIATESSCLLYQVRRNRPAEAFVEFMRNHSIIKYMVDPSGDLRKLSNWFRSFNISICLPLQSKEAMEEKMDPVVALPHETFTPRPHSTPLTGDSLKDVKQLKLCFPSIVNLDTHQVGASSLCRKFLNLGLNKSPKIVLSRWSRFTLHKDQVEYAVCDAFLNVKLASLMKEQLEAAE
uniref:3'-5' exonuclease domain-containing protein n=1 Tax=Percolomonas cosmopolitus TaxID=63605 RepID=A0A7S1KMQ5_9EUKA|mmetsp:Transcript_1865/g.6607  ORF Transcript_1865/g.6607 Transcript_1865/m.6607 type:complete len:343 (+) Transcript_1865:643-1671(+)